MTLPSEAPAQPAASADDIVRVLTYHLWHRDASVCGDGADEYARDRVLSHPMAYALYVRGFLALAAATHDGTHQKAAKVAAARLLELSVDAPGRAWGLPFAWRDHPADHPYAITTALATLALTSLAPWDEAWAWRTASAESSAWLTHQLPWSPSDGGAAPWYAPGEPVLTYNVAASVAAALAEAFEIHQQAAFLTRFYDAVRYVLAGQERSGAWRYSSQSADRDAGYSESESVVDLVHTAYTLEGLITALITSERSAVPLPAEVPEVISRGIDFLHRHLIAGVGIAREKVVLIESPQDETASLLFDESVTRAPMTSGGWVVEFPTESRAWGYGAAMGMLSRAVRLGFRNARDPLETLANRALTSFGCDPAGRFPYRAGEPLYFPRHESHIFAGLAEYALTLSSSAATRG